MFLEPRAVCTGPFTAALYHKRSRWRSLLLAKEVQRDLQASEYRRVRTGTQIKSQRLRHRYSPVRAFYFYKAKISVDLPVSLESARGPLFPSLATLLLFLVLIWTVLSPPPLGCQLLFFLSPRFSLLFPTKTGVTEADHPGSVLGPGRGGCFKPF